AIAAASDIIQRIRHRQATLQGNRACCAILPEGGMPGLAIAAASDIIQRIRHRQATLQGNRACCAILPEGG
ncbi:hypothetical protein C0U41_29745, partial [Klebsiella pneumoniae]